VLLNVKKDNQLNQLEESVLNGVILKNFGNFSPDEIKHAFRLAVAGELGVEMYQKLDSITMGKVLGAYKIYKAKKIKNFKSSNMSGEQKKPSIDEINAIEQEFIKNCINEQKKPSIDEINAIEQEFIKNCINPYVEERKTMKQPKIDWATYAIFNHFWNLKYIKLSKTEIKKYKKEAEKYWQADLKKRRTSGERVSLDEIMSQRTAKMYASCVALYHKMDDILKHIEIEVKGWNNKL